MKKRRNVKIIILALMISIISSFVVFANEGLGIVPSRSSDNAKAWKYFNEDNTKVVNQWRQVNGDWYYFGEDGISKQSTWAEIDGKWYYFDSFSRMLHDTTTPDGYTVGSDGVWTAKSEEAIDTSRWLGSYLADDGQRITVNSVNSSNVDITFEGYSEEGWYKQNYVLVFGNVNKTQAIFESEQIKDKDIYTLTENGIKVSVEPIGGWKQGTYVRQ